MSVTIMLVPAIIAAIAAASGAGAVGAVGAGLTARKGETVQVATRMKDRTLLGAALEDCAATGIQITDASVTATIGDLTLTMTRNESEIWEAHFESATGGTVDEVAASEFIGRLDTAYAARVQSAVAAKIRAKADDAGLDLVSETVEDDATVTMVLNVRQDA